MKHILRSTLNILAVPSLLVCAAMVVMWVRSFWICDGLTWAAYRGTHVRAATLYFPPGRIGVGLFYCLDHHPEWDQEAFAPERTDFKYESWKPSSPPYGPNGRVDWGMLDFKYDGGTDSRGPRFEDKIRIIEGPDWAIIAATAVLPLCWIAEHRRKKWQNTQGKCPQCGYDVYAYQRGDTCPKCGRVVGT